MSSKTTFSNSTSKSYALALYALSKESSNTDKVENEMKSVGNLLNESVDFKETIMNPMISKEDKKNIIFKIAEKNNFSEISKKFLGFLSNKNRLFFLDKIIESFLSLTSNIKGELKAKLFSSKELTKQEQEKIQNELSAKFNSKLKIDYKYDPDLIGGLIIQVGSIMVDTSIKTKLSKIQKNMIGI